MRPTARSASPRRLRSHPSSAPATTGASPARASTTTPAIGPFPERYSRPPLRLPVGKEEIVDRDSIDRIRSATFPVGRRGYEKREVDRFLAKLADWLETGGGDQTRAELLRRELERVGQQTGKILTDAHEDAEELRADDERQARRIIDDASASD